MICIHVRPEFSEEYTEISIEGEHEEDLANMLTARLQATDWEVLTEEDKDE